MALLALQTLPVFRGRHAGMLLEAFAEILRVGEAYGVGNLRECHSTLFHEIFGTFHSDVAQEIVRQYGDQLAQEGQPVDIQSLESKKDKLQKKIEKY